VDGIYFIALISLGARLVLAFVSDYRYQPDEVFPHLKPKAPDSVWRWPYYLPIDYLRIYLPGVGSVQGYTS
jgi:hypothetical protein